MTFTQDSHTIPLINLRAQYQAYKDEIDSAIARVLHTQHFLLGQEMQALEQELAIWTNRRFCITCASGTSALLLALCALGIGKDDEVITPSFSFIAAAEMIAFLGAKVIFVDICPHTFTIDIEQVKRSITTKTKAIIPVCLFGLPYDVEGLRAVADGIPIIEDGAQSFGAHIATTSSAYSGSFGDISITSFFPSKPLGCYGDGGAVFCDDENLASKLQALRNHGQIRKYQHAMLGCNARLDELQCAILRIKLAHFPHELASRQELASRYIYHLSPLSHILTLQHIPTHYHSVFAQFCVLAKNRHSMIEALHKHHIATAIHYSTPLHLQEAFQYLGYKEGGFPISEQISKQILSLPFCAFLKEETQHYIINVLKHLA